MVFVPKKNISSKLHDIKHDLKKDHKKTVNSDKFYFFNKKNISQKEKKIKYIVSFGICTLLILGGIYTIAIKNSFADSLEYIALQAKLLKDSVLYTETSEIKNSLGAINNEIQNIGTKADSYGVIELITLIGQFNSSLKEIPGAFKNIEAISAKSSSIANNIDYLKNNALQLIFNQKGIELLDKLTALEKDLSDLEDLTSEFKSQALKIRNLNSKLASLYKIFDENYISINLNIYKARELVIALNSMLRSPEDTKILLLFQNPTEIRPAGGFIGSFGYITLNRGSVKEIKIDDIYNADRQLNIAITPPKELSAITDKWGARDANWFFNFPESAKKVSYFLENSKLFSETETKFENVIAINTNILKLLIEITGEIEIPQYNLTINSENFLKEIQYEVEAGIDKKPGQNPKKILSVLTPLLIDKLKNLGESEKIRMIQGLNKAVNQKDIMAFSKNEEMQKIFFEYGISGEVFSIPKNFNGDYLAVVNTNVAGGKSDAFINQQIVLKSQILEDGSMHNKLLVTRTHNGQNEKDWWYKATNKNFIKIFLPEQSEILSLSGNTTSPYKYLAPNKGLLIDPDLQSLEKTYIYNNEFKIWEGNENQKKSVTTWLITKAGSSTNFEIDYKENSNLEIKDGAEFTFVFDKQSGNQGSLEYEISAPPGYVWAESKNPKFSYGTQDLLTRESIKLTLKKNLGF